MARYDIYANSEGPGYLLDVQSDTLAQFNTRVVIPLLPTDMAPQPARTLNPVFEFNGVSHVLVTQYLAALPVKLLKDRLFNLESQRAEIVAAMDLLLQGF